MLLNSATIVTAAFHVFKAALEKEFPGTYFASENLCGSILSLGSLLLNEFLFPQVSIFDGWGLTLRGSVPYCSRVGIS